MNSSEQTFVIWVAHGEQGLDAGVHVAAVGLQNHQKQFLIHIGKHGLQFCHGACVDLLRLLLHLRRG